MLDGLDGAAPDGIIDWRRVKNASNSFVFVRAAYGMQADSNLPATAQPRRGCLHRGRVIAFGTTVKKAGLTVLSGWLT